MGWVSIIENNDWSTPVGRFLGREFGNIAELYSDLLGVHVQLGVDGRINKRLHVGSLPFGYQSCYVNGQLRCDRAHAGGVHVVLEEEEAEAVKNLFRRYLSGTVTLFALASWMNSQGFKTRNTKRLADGNGSLSAGPRLFTTASVRGILHNMFYTGTVRHRDQLLVGAHQPLVSQDVFDAVQITLSGNSGRSETVNPRPQREYLPKGLVRCPSSLIPLWAQTLTSDTRVYREQARSRSLAECPADGRSIRCDIPDDQIGRIVSAIVLPDAWMDRVLAQVHLADEVQQVTQARKETEQRLKRLGQVYMDGLKTPEEYQREKRLLEDRLDSLVLPDIDAAMEAGKLLENLPFLWEQANLGERRRLLLSMLDAVYVDTIEERSVVAVTPKPAFMPLFEVATTREGSEVVLIQEKDLPPVDPEAPGPCLWWRRGRVELILKHGLVVLLAAGWARIEADMAAVA